MDKLNIFRQMHHVCIVVYDIKKAVKYYESIGVGPWNDYPSLEKYSLEGSDRSAFLKLTYKYANLENIQIQLCQPGEGETPQKRFLETKGEGVYHLGFTVPDCDFAEAEAKKAGLSVKTRARLSDGSGFTYFETAERGAGVTLEVRARRDF